MRNRPPMVPLGPHPPRRGAVSHTWLEFLRNLLACKGAFTDRPFRLMGNTR